jgi:tetratricopeptide (TPR) repeat protein
MGPPPPITPARCTGAIPRAALVVLIGLLACQGADRSQPPEPAPEPVAARAEAPGPANEGVGRAQRGPIRVERFLRGQPSEPAFRSFEAELEAELQRSPDAIGTLLDLAYLLDHWYGRQAEIGGAPQPRPPRIDGLYQRAIELQPAHQRASSEYASFLEHAGRYDEALAQLDRMEGLGIVLPPDRHLRATLLLHEGRFEEARAVLEALVSELEVDDTHLLMPRSLQQLGRVYTRLGLHRQAEAALMRSLEAAQVQRDGWGVACAYTALGELYRLRGQDSEGLELMVKAAELEPHKAWIQYEAALFAYYSGEPDTARRYLQRAQEHGEQEAFDRLRLALGDLPEPTGGAGVERLAEPAIDAALRAFQRHDFAQAEGFVELAFAQEPSVEARTLRAMLLVLRRDYAGARALMEGLEDDTSALDNQQLVGAHLAIAAKDYPRAQELLERLEPRLQWSAAQQQPTADPSGWHWLQYELTQLGLGWCAANQAQHHRALERFERVLAWQPSDIFALIGVGNSANAMGDPDGAEAALQRVLELDPDNAYAKAELGLVAYNRGQDELAEASFLEALALEPETYTCPYEGLGLVYLRQGRSADARAAFERAIEINPDIEYQKYNGLARIHIAEGRLDEAERLIVRSRKNAPWAEDTRALWAELEAARAEAAAPAPEGTESR